MSFTERILHGAKQLTTSLKSYVDQQIATRALLNHKHNISDIIGTIQAEANTLPSWQNAQLLLTTYVDSNAGLPIWKINVPGIILCSGPYNDFNQDTCVYVSNTVAALQQRNPNEQTKNRYVVLCGTASDTHAGGSYSTPIITPGTSTYFALGGGYIGYAIIFIPTTGAVQYARSKGINNNASWCVQKGTIISDWANDLVSGNDLIAMSTPNDASWTKIFGGNWKTNI